MKKTSILFVTTISLILGISCTKKNEKLRIGLNAWPGYEFIYLMNEKKFDKELGVETEIIYFNSLADARRSFERGELDLLASTVVETIFIEQNSKRNPKIIYILDYSNGADVIISKDKIRQIKDLKEKKIGVETGSICIYVLYNALKKENLTFDDVKIVEADQDAISKGLQSGTLDVGVTYPPFSLKFLSDKKYNKLFSSKDSPKQFLDVLVTSAEVVKNRKEDLQKILKAIEKARVYSLQEGSDGISLMAKREKISPEEFNKVLKEEIEITPYSIQNSDYFSTGSLQKIVQETFEALKSSKQIGEKAVLGNLIEKIVEE